MWSGTTWYFSNKCTCCTDTGLLSRRAYVQTYFMMDKSSGIIMVMISCRTQRHQLVEKLFRVLTVMDKSQELQTRATLYDTHRNECYFYICQQVHISPFITPPNPIVYIRVVQSYTYDHHHGSYVAIFPASSIYHAGGMSCVEFYDKWERNYFGSTRKGVLTQKTLFTRTRTEKEVAGQSQ